MNRLNVWRFGLFGQLYISIFVLGFKLGEAATPVDMRKSSWSGMKAGLSAVTLPELMLAGAIWLMCDKVVGQSIWINVLFATTLLVIVFGNMYLFDRGERGLEFLERFDRLPKSRKVELTVAAAVTELLVWTVSFWLMYRYVPPGSTR